MRTSSGRGRKRRASGRCRMDVSNFVSCHVWMDVWAKSGRFLATDGDERTKTKMDACMRRDKNAGKNHPKEMRQPIHSGGGRGRWVNPLVTSGRKAARSVWKRQGRRPPARCAALSLLVHVGNLATSSPPWRGEGEEKGGGKGTGAETRGGDSRSWFGRRAGQPTVARYSLTGDPACPPCEAGWLNERTHVRAAISFFLDKGH